MTDSVFEKTWLRAALRTSAATGALLAGMTMTAYAQDEAAPEAEADDTIIVTGSRIPVSSNLDSSSPITQLTSDEFTLRGTSKVEDIVNTLPQAFAAQGSSIANGSSGTATINLRNLGADRTLVLIDGRRMPYGSAPFTTAADVNQIPAALVERVELVTGGASAVYGSDAMAGVVNFIMKRDFEGLRFDGQFSFFQHDNNNEFARNLLDAAGYPAPDDSVLDGFGKDFSVIAGTNFDNDRGNITAYFTYHHNKEVLQANRDYSACAFAVGAGGAFDPLGTACGGSATTAPAAFTPDFINFLTLDENSDGLRTLEDRDLYNYGPLNHYRRPDERFLFGAFAHYEINQYADVYFDLMFHDDRTIAQIAPSGVFFVTSTMNCDNPLMSAQQAADIGCTPADIANGDRVPLFIGRRNVEGDPRQDDLRHTTYRLVGGVRGETGIEGFTYDINGMWANVHLSENYLNEVSISRAMKALDVIDDGMGNPVCRSTTLDPSDPGFDGACVPYNVWQAGGITQQALDYLIIDGLSDGSNTQQMVSGNITIDMDPYDGRSPWAKDAIGMVLGAEYRRDTMDFNTDLSFCNRDPDNPQEDLAGQGGPTCPVKGATEVYEGYVEMRLPLIQGRSWIHDLTGDFGYRYSEYDLAGSTHSWKLMGNFSPTEDIRFRGGWQRAVRAPNVIELFLPQRVALFNLAAGDPCGVPSANPATPAQCANTGLNPADFPVGNNPAGQYNQFIGGNPELEPETADTYTIGAVLTPGFAPNLIVSVDWFDIKVNEFIGTVPPALALNNCVENGDPFFCSLIHRDPATGSLWAGNGGIDAFNVNTGFYWTRGLDIQAAYNFDFEDLGAAGWGSMAFDFVGTWLEKLDIEPLPGEDIVQCVGFHTNQTCGEVPVPEWRHKFRAIWQTPIALDLSVTWRYFGEAASDPVDGGTHDFDSQSYVDLAARYQLLDNVALRMGVNNITDVEPPVTEVGAGFGNGNTYPQFYDCCGRYFFFSATVNF